jgi:Sigma 54 modulation protein / S30EA ribosomal protein
VAHFLCDIYDRRDELSRRQMQIRVDADNHIDSNEELADRVEGVVEGSLERYRDRVVFVQVYLSRLSHHRQGERDICCRMEAQAHGFSGQAGSPNPIVVSHEALTLTEAIHAASVKLERAVHEALKSPQSQWASLKVSEGPGSAERLGHVGSS